MCRSLMALLALLLGGCNLSGLPSTPLPTPDRPTVRFLYPANNSAVLEGVDLNIELVATDPGAGVARVELLIDDQPHQEGKPEIAPAVPTFTVVMNWRVSGAGQHSLTAVAYRLDGSASPPETILVQVVPQNSE